jgi:hypothetical protein
MKTKAMWWIVCACTLVLVMSIGALAQAPVQVKLSGVINDYTPETIVPFVGPWEIRGDWSLKVKGDSGKADFSAALTMVRSDYWVLTFGADPEDPSLRRPHTHHITLVDGDVTPITNGFRVTGMATITTNGSPDFSPSSLQIDITGGSLVVFSNIHVTFGSPASGHFGSQPLDGVVGGSRASSEGSFRPLDSPAAWQLESHEHCAGGN